MTKPRVRPLTFVSSTAALIFAALTLVRAAEPQPKRAPPGRQARVPAAWVENSWTQPLPSNASPVRLGLPAPLEKIGFVPTTTAVPAGFGRHAGAHVEGKDRIVLYVAVGEPIRSWAGGRVTGVAYSGGDEDCPNEYAINLDYGSGLMGGHTEIAQPLVKAGDTVTEGQPIGYGCAYPNASGYQSGEFALMDANRSDGPRGNWGTGSVMVSAFDYLKPDVQLAFVAMYREKIIEPYIAKGTGTKQMVVTPWEPFLTNPLLLHSTRRGTIVGEWYLTGSRWAGGGHPDLLTLLAVDHTYYKGKRLMAIDVGGTGNGFTSGTWEADYTQKRLTMTMTPEGSTSSTTYYGIFELDETGSRAKLRLEYQQGSYPTAFSSNAAVYIERAAVPVTDDGADLGLWPCDYGLMSSSQSFARSGGSGTVEVWVWPHSDTCTWTAMSNVSWIRITAGTTGYNGGTVSYAVSENTTGASRTGTFTLIGGTNDATRTFTVTQTTEGPTCSFSISPTSASVQAAGGTGSVTVTGSDGCAWTAASNASWIGVAPASGVGSGTVTYTVASYGGTANRSGTATIATQTFTVTQTAAAPTTAGPFGGVDTPVQGATGLTGSIAVTGWALDDIEVTAVRLLRDPVAGEPVGTRLPLGAATLVAGARPDIATAYPSYPFKDRAGWGYLLLTNMLPNQGNGTYTLSVYADDRDGHSTLLGTRTITCTNSGATKPFGAIDTPAQGETVSGSAYVNWGWVLTPLPKAIAPDGSTIQVYVDGVAVGTVTYNNYRADIATLFPGLANSNGAIGVRTINTTTLANGLHTIQWVVTDNAGVSEGIGSRYFTVQNGSSQVGRARPGVLGAAELAVGQPGQTVAQALVRIPRSREWIAVTRGYRDDVPVELMAPDAEAHWSVRAVELERLTLALSGAAVERSDRPWRSTRSRYSGYEVVAGEPRPLPIGSTLDPQTGVFTWQPGPGFLGRFDLVFVRTESISRQQWRVKVVIKPQR